MNPIVIGYDGSEGARAAIAYGGSLLGGRAALVVTVLEDWPPVVSGDAAPSAGIDEVRLSRAGETAAEGVALARSAGFDAEPRVEVAPRKAWESLVAVADEVDAALILVGSHGFNGLRPLVLGSVSHQLAHHAHQPVLAVPTPDAVAARRAQTRRGVPEHAAH